ncbi:MAG: PAS domain S-box protein [Dehalococcoidia bacterium]
MSDESVGQPSPLMDLRHLPATDLIESLPDAIVCIDGGGRMIAVNGRTEALFGYERAALNGATLGSSPA